MTLHDDITALVQATPVTVYFGYAANDAVLPYVVHRPLSIDFVDIALSGDTVVWDYQTSLYCCAGSVEAAHNLALLVMLALHGKRVGSTVATLSLGYVGARVEGHYESQITIQLNQGVTS